MRVSSPFKQHKEDILLGAEVFHRGRPSTNLTPQDVVEDLSHIFLSLEETDKELIIKLMCTNRSKHMQKFLRYLLSHGHISQMQSCDLQFFTSFFLFEQGGRMSEGKRGRERSHNTVSHAVMG